MVLALAARMMRRMPLAWALCMLVGCAPPPPAVHVAPTPRVAAARTTERAPLPWRRLARFGSGSTVVGATSVQVAQDTSGTAVLLAGSGDTRFDVDGVGEVAGPVLVRLRGNDIAWTKALPCSGECGIGGRVWTMRGGRTVVAAFVPETRIVVFDEAGNELAHASIDASAGGSATVDDLVETSDGELIVALSVEGRVRLPGQRRSIDGHSVGTLVVARFSPSLELRGPAVEMVNVVEGRLALRADDSVDVFGRAAGRFPVRVGRLTAPPVPGAFQRIVSVHLDRAGAPRALTSTVVPDRVRDLADVEVHGTDRVLHLAGATFQHQPYPPICALRLGRELEPQRVECSTARGEVLPRAGAAASWVRWRGDDVVETPSRPGAPIVLERAPVGDGAPARRRTIEVGATWNVQPIAVLDGDHPQCLVLATQGPGTAGDIGLITLPEEGLAGSLAIR